MAYNTTVKILDEARVYLSSSALTLTSIDTADVATELGSAAAMGWQEIGFVRAELTWTEPQSVTPIWKRFDIDHVKRARQEPHTGSLVAAFQNPSDSILRHFKGVHSIMKIEWHVDDAGAVDAYEYLKDIVVTNYTRSAPASPGEATERMDFQFADYGNRLGP